MQSREESVAVLSSRINERVLVEEPQVEAFSGSFREFDDFPANRPASASQHMQLISNPLR